MEFPPNINPSEATDAQHKKKMITHKAKHKTKFH
jgi:hypothetical protein